ncbi:PIN domain-containing protein [Thermosynechococcaceae cyanobacterium BACA0444]|uniref:PIN domain-containing protein n=1 Tax=Pseudocalidococcus azoricus BACA0444 TaxID=2918990 RepID=A0AAE4FVW8_9CYAN|nr:PIN domain-containing protein [Pseudocalidococcus azoricus]MDS3862026.1 PIN domain-containing protein [Pseudocalidococcus azoricus BACA0444]
MRVLVDTNIILDFLLERAPFFIDAEALFQEIASGEIISYATATTLTDIFYIARRHTQSIERARQVIEITLSAMEICPVDRSALELALTSTTLDFEDAVQIACASTQSLDAIVTRDAYFSTSLVPVLSVSQVLQKLATLE